MLTRYLLLLSYSIMFLLNGSLFAQEAPWSRRSMGKPNFYQIKKEAEAYFQKHGHAGYKNEHGEEDSEYHKYKRWEWYWRDRIMPDGSFPDIGNMHQAQARKSNAKAMVGGSWVNFSQTNCTGGYNGMGRATSIAFHPSNANIFYVGSPIGGLWKTSDGGTTYTPLGDNLPYVSAGNILVDYSNPNTLYISLGDNIGWWNAALGVYKSTDGGTTWNPTALTWTFNAGVAVYRMEMSPTNAQIILAATTNGLYRTTNGGANWTQVRTGSHGDVKFKPGDGTTVYAATDNYWGVSQVYKSTDGGANWTQSSNFTQGQNFIRLAVTPANNALIAAVHTNGGAFYVSTDNGLNYALRGTAPSTDALYISPVNANNVYVGGVDTHKSTNGGSNWTQITHWCCPGAGQVEIHADFHYTRHNPLNNYIYFCNDGGLYRYNEGSNVWTEMTNGLVITQFYRLATAQSNATVVIGGTQDNGGRRRNALGNWVATNGGDAMEVAIDPTNANIIYTTYVNGQLYRSMDGWVADQYNDIRANIPGVPGGDWVTPYVLDPSAPATIVAGYQDVFRSTNRGDNWTQISFNLTGNVNNKLQCIAVAPSNSNVIYASYNNSLYVTTNLGGGWVTRTPFTGDRIASITVHPTDPNKVWVTRTGYAGGNKVYYSANGGVNWNNISGSLPNVPANAFAYQKNSADILYVGTDAGVFYRDNTMGDWVLYGVNLPNTAVTDIEIQYSAKKLRVSTFGRGLWENDLADVPTPVTLAAFQGQWKDKNTVQLNWVTYTEHNASHFVIYRSYDGAHFDSIGSVAATGNTAQMQLYAFEDTPGVGTGLVYYQLKQEDQDAQFYFSEVIRVKAYDEISWIKALYPNPVDQIMYLELLELPEEDLVVQWFDLHGKRVKIQLWPAGSLQETTLSLNISELQAGVYLCNIHTGNYQLYKKIVKGKALE